ncbi:MAG: hypothetical protein JSW00_17505 [Thermoplasmata archaeon]|nr:MAG: hypothetical protein JSW00_17505 [Thermoplasmata archaeon]
MRKVGSTLLIAFLILQFTFCFLPFSATAGPMTQVTMDPEYQEKEVDVAPGSSGFVSSAINVSCQTLDPAPVMVSLSADFPDGAISLNPASLVFQGPETEPQDVKIGMTVPLLTQASEIPCTISGTWTQGAFAGSLEPVTILVFVLPFHRPNISCESPKKEVNKGDGVSFELRINNSGNADDIFHIEIANLEDLKSKGITVDEISDISIAFLGHELVQVKVHVSSDTKVKGANIDIVVTSTLDEEQEEFTYQVNIKINDNPFGLDILSNPLIIVVIIVVIIAVIVYYVKKKKATPKSHS